MSVCLSEGTELQTFRAVLSAPIAQTAVQNRAPGTLTAAEALLGRKEELPLILTEKVPKENQERPAQINLQQQNQQSSPREKCFLGSKGQHSLCCTAAPTHGPCSPFSSHGLGAASFPGSTATAQHISDRSPKPWSHGPLPPGRVREGAPGALCPVPAQHCTQHCHGGSRCCRTASWEW